MSTAPSYLMRLAKWYLRRQGKTLSPENFSNFRRALLGRSYPAAAPVPASLRKLCDLRDETVAGQRVYTVAPKRGVAPLRVVYLHGGAYVNPLRAAHWTVVKELVVRTGATVTVPLYPLAPEHDHRSAFALLREVHVRIKAEEAHAPLVLAGDSAGGGLALAFAMHCRDNGMERPARLILFSPWLDITMSNPEAKEIEPRDVMLGVDSLRYCGEWWAGHADSAAPHLSPLFGDLGQLPPVDVYQGTDDIFLADARRLKAKLIAARGAVRLFEYPGAFHVFVAAPFLPEARDAWRKVASSLNGR